jgi:hypothetical protein
MRNTRTARNANRFGPRLDAQFDDILYFTYGNARPAENLLVETPDLLGRTAAYPPRAFLQPADGNQGQTLDAITVHHPMSPLTNAATATTVVAARRDY